MASVVGTRNPKYTLFGDTVRGAARGGRASSATRIGTSESSHRDRDRVDLVVVVVGGLWPASHWQHRPQAPGRRLQWR